jgi:hypothetical protein
MSAKRAFSPRPLPTWLMWVASGLIALHLFAVGILVLAAPSGPWPTPFGPSQALPPAFAGRISDVSTAYYLRPLHMMHNYHFMSNRPDQTAIFFEVRLKSEAGEVVKTLRFPEKGANAWVKQRQELLAQGLGDDEQVQAPRGEVIPAPGQKMERVPIWEPVGENQFALREVELHLIPKDRPVFRPREWSVLLVRSYLRHLCREYGAASAELTRHSRQAVMPALLYLPAAPPGTYDTLQSTF